MNKKICVLHIITRLDLGGSSTNTIETVFRLNKDKYKTILLAGKTYDPHGNIIQSLHDRHINYTFCNSLVRNVNPLWDIKALFEIYRFIKKNNIDVVHTHSSKAGIVGRWAAKLAGVKTIIHTPHGHVFFGYFNRATTFLFIVLEKWTAKITKKIITLTDKGIEDHVKVGIAPREKFVTIYSGIDIENFMLDESKVTLKRSDLNIPENAFIFGTVARLEPVKGNIYLIEAFARVLKELPQAFLLIVGEGSQRKLLEEKAQRLGLAKNIRFTGYRSDVAQCINLFNVFVLASLNEGMGRVILEAMTAGKPVVATEVGGIPELVENEKTGFLVVSEEEKELALAMLRLCFLEKERFEEMSKNAQKRVSNRFSLDKMIRDIDALYEEVCEKK